ncbi:APC membrane recruitment protein 2 [Pseudophryne corroboree]|uniref:APC membrane recruitment protein 2 n=1 Tax=Pseudophryne corroboree TaxID=495146 RepID=UPI003081F231
MEMNRSSREAASEKISIRHLRGSAGGRRQDQGETANMDLHCDCADSPAAEQPSGKINKTAFKLFGKRKSGSAMPTIFGVKSKGDGKNAGQMGMVRSKTLDGLADVVLESSKREEQCASEAAVDTPSVDASTQPVTVKTDVSPNSSVAKSHSFFSLLKKNGKLENVKGENAEQRAGSRQKKGLKGLFSSMRWNRKDKYNKDDREGATEDQPGLILSGSLTASLECIKEEIQKPLREPEVPPEIVTVDLPCEEQTVEVNTSLEDKPLEAAEESPCSSHHTNKPHDGNAAAGSPHMDIICQFPEPDVEIPQEKEDENVTGCGDIIAEPDEEGGSSTAARIIHGNGRKAPYKKTPNMIVYQGGGEEMASPDQVDDKNIQEFLGITPQPEETSKEVGKVSIIRQASREEKRLEDTCDGNIVKPAKLKQVAANGSEKGDVKNGGKEQRDSIRNSDEGYWDSPIPVPEEEPPKSAGKKAFSRDSYSGDALYDLYTETDDNTARAQAEEKRLCQVHTKPLSPVTVTCPVKTNFTKDSKIPISIKHLPVHGPSQPAETGINSTSSVVQHQPAKSELPRTKIPVSKVLVRRVSNKAITGTSGKTALHEPARK